LLQVTVFLLPHRSGVSNVTITRECSSSVRPSRYSACHSYVDPCLEPKNLQEHPKITRLGIIAANSLSKFANTFTEVNLGRVACSIPPHLAPSHAPKRAASEPNFSRITLHYATARPSPTSWREDPSVPQSLGLRAMALRRARFGGLGSVAEILGYANRPWPQLRFPCSQSKQWPKHTTG